MNGDSGDMDQEEKDDIPDDLPRTTSWDSGTGFLLEWFSIFYDLFSAQRKPNLNPAAQQYLTNHQVRALLLC